MAGQKSDFERSKRRVPGAVKFALIPVTALCVLTLPIENFGFGQSPPPAKSQSPPAAKKSGSAPAAAPSAPPAKGTAAPAAAAPRAPQGAIASDDDPRVKAAVARAVAWMRTRPANTAIGPIALMVHAMAKVREKYPDLVPTSDPVLQSFVDTLRAHCPPDGFKPQMNNGPDNYEAGCVAMALTAVDGQAYKNEIKVVLDFILSRQLQTGAWSYPDHGRQGDTSMTQYAVLGMWEASAGAGIPVSKEKWDNAAQWLIKTQHGDGGFEYHPEDKQAATHTMTVASLGSLYIAQSELGGKRRTSRGGVLQAVQDDEERKNERYTPVTKPSEFDDALKRATEWITKNFTLDKPTGAGDSGGNRWGLYYLYAFERFATLAELKEINGVDWYDAGAKILLSKQDEHGAWPGQDGGAEAATGFAVLFLVRSTAISKKIHTRRIGRGTLVSGRGLPQNLADLEQVAGGFKAKAKVGKTGDLLQSIETGKSEELDASALGLVKQMYEKKWTAAGEEGDRLKKIYERGVKTKNSEVIKAAMKLLALTGDYRVVPLLIDGMYYEDDAEVQLEARLALCKISRKFNGFGSIYPEEATKEQWEEEIARWKDWYKQVRPESSFEDEVEIGK
jgi:hypothetical protein